MISVHPGRTTLTLTVGSYNPGISVKDIMRLTTSRDPIDVQLHTLTFRSADKFMLVTRRTGTHSVSYPAIDSYGEQGAVELFAYSPIVSECYDYLDVVFLRRLDHVV